MQDSMRSIAEEAWEIRNSRFLSFSQIAEKLGVDRDLLIEEIRQMLNEKHRLDQGRVEESQVSEFRP